MKNYKNSILMSLKNNDLTIVCGAVGTGKSALVKAIASENDFDLFTICTTLIYVEDLDSFIFNFVPKKDTIICLEEIDRTSLTLHENINSLINRINNMKTEFNVYICAMINNQSFDLTDIAGDINYNMIDYDLNIDDYLKYMGDNLIPEISDFLKNHPQYLNILDANPRNWTHLSRYLNNPKIQRKKAIKELTHIFIGTPASQALYKFIYGNKTK